MATINITKVVVDDKGRIHIYDGKISYIFGDRGRLQEMAERVDVKSRDLRAQAACRYVMSLPEADIEAVSRVPVVY